MPVPSAITDLSQTAANNYPSGSESPITADDYFRAHASFIALLRDGKGFTDMVTLASGSTTDIGGQNAMAVEITGTTTITSFGTTYNGPRFLRFTGALTLTHNATSLILPGGSNITTAAGDTCIAIPNSSANGWVVLAYQRGANNPDRAASGANSDITSMSALTAITTTGGIDIKGTNTNDSAATGDVGEYVESNITSFGGSLSDTVAANLTGISLTAGDWDVSGVVYVAFTAGGNSITQLIGAISTTSATLPSLGQQASIVGVTLNPGTSTVSVVCPEVRLSLSSTTTVYLVVRASFASGTLQSAGKISARRRR